MGTLAEGTRCYYCDAELAGYIPDGGGPIGGACLAVLIHRGEWALAQVRLNRRVAGWRCVAPGPGPARADQVSGRAQPGFRRLLDVAAIAEHIAQFCIWC